MNGTNNNNNNSMTASYQGAGSNAVSSPRILLRNNSQSFIPLPRYTSATTLKIGAEGNNSPTMTRPSTIYGNNDNKWQTMYEETERKRKALVTKTQKEAREHADLQRRHQQLSEDSRSVQQQLKQKEAAFAELRRVSEAMYKEYDNLKNKYETETGALHEAMKSATQWYKQNRVLKRQSTMMAQKFLTLSPGGVIDFETTDMIDSAEKEDRELEDLRKSVKDLSEEVGRLRSELSSARLEEFEAQEQAVNLATELETERSARKLAEAELGDLRAMQDNLSTVSQMVASEMEALRNQCQQEQQVAEAMKLHAHQAQKERNILAHQSSLLLADVTSDERQMRLLQEVESLKRALEDEQRQNATNLQDLQDKFEEREGEAQLELLEEKLKLAESELQCALHRAERAESHTTELSSAVSRLEAELVSKLAPPPPPPPPPPPMPPALPTQPRRVPNAVLDMAKMLGVPHKQSSALPQGGAINDIINQIKGGKFNLKVTEKQNQRKAEAPVPPAVQEMLNILGTMKRRPKPKPNAAPADVAL